MVIGRETSCTAQVTFINGYGNLTDFRVSRKGEYTFKLSVSYPENVSDESALCISKHQAITF